MYISLPSSFPPSLPPSLVPPSPPLSSRTDGGEGLTRSLSQSSGTRNRLVNPSRGRSRPHVFSSFLEEHSARRLDQPAPTPESFQRSQTLPSPGRYRAPAQLPTQNLPRFRAPSPILVGNYDSEPPRWPARGFQGSSHRQRAESVDGYGYSRIK